jgi:TusA-related sulfurtransferase
MKTADLRSEKCPLTLMRTVQLLAPMLPGEELIILVKGAEPVRDMSANLTREGHVILSTSTLNDDIHRIRIRRGILATDNAMKEDNQ